MSADVRNRLVELGLSHWISEPDRIRRGEGLVLVTLTDSGKKSRNLWVQPFLTLRGCLNAFQFHPVAQK